MLRRLVYVCLALLCLGSTASAATPPPRVAWVTPDSWVSSAEFRPALEILRNANLPFPPEALQMANWRERLASYFDKMPELQQDRDELPSWHLTGGLVMARSLRLAPVTTVGDDVVILVRRLTYTGNHSLIFAPGHNVTVLIINDVKHFDDVKKDRHTVTVVTGAFRHGKDPLAPQWATLLTRLRLMAPMAATDAGRIADYDVWADGGDGQVGDDGLQGMDGTEGAYGRNGRDGSCGGERNGSNGEDGNNGKEGGRGGAPGVGSGGLSSRGITYTIPPDDPNEYAFHASGGKGGRGGRGGDGGEGGAGGGGGWGGRGASCSDSRPGISGLGGKGGSGGKGGQGSAASGMGGNGGNGGAVTITHCNGHFDVHAEAGPEGEPGPAGRGGKWGNPAAGGDSYTGGFSVCTGRFESKPPRAPDGTTYGWGDQGGVGPGGSNGNPGSLTVRTDCYRPHPPPGYPQCDIWEEIACRENGTSCHWDSYSCQCICGGGGEGGGGIGVMPWWQGQ